MLIRLIVLLTLIVASGVYVHEMTESRLERTVDALELKLQLTGIEAKADSVEIKQLREFRCDHEDCCEGARTLLIKHPRLLKKWYNEANINYKFKQ